MRYVQIRDMDISNGEGIGVSLFVQGCHFHCDGCFNKETWDFDGGHEFTVKENAEIIKLIKKPFISRFSVLGGEPLAKENVDGVYYTITSIKVICPDKKIWLYTGYNFDDFAWEEHDKGQITTSSLRTEILRMCDVVVDGPYDKTCPANYMHPWKGSMNQRVIDVKRSITEGKVIEI